MDTDKNAEFDTSSFEQESINQDSNAKVTVQPVAKGKRRKTTMAKVQMNKVVDDLKDIARYLVFDVILPEVKQTLYKAICGGAHKALWHDEQNHTTDRYTVYDRPSYGDGYWYRNSYPISPSYNSGSNKVVSREIPRSELEVYFRTREEAQRVMDTILQKYDDSGYVTVNDYYVMSGLSSDFTKEPYGWESLPINSVRVEHTPYGFTIRMPKARILNW